MFITGNDSSRTVLRWYLTAAARCRLSPGAFGGVHLVVSIPDAAWALWLATALIRWLRLGLGALPVPGLHPVSKA